MVPVKLEAKSSSGGHATLLKKVRCPLSKACGADDDCASGYAKDAFLCGACSEGYALSSSLETCVPCESANP